MSRTHLCHVSGEALVTSIHRRLRGHAVTRYYVRTFPSVMFTYFYEIMKISTICIRNSSWMVIGSYASIVFLPFTPDLDLGLLTLLLLRAALLFSVFAWVRVLISAVAGRLVGASF